MGSVTTFEEFEVWRTAREIARQVYALTRRSSFSADFGLKYQICKATVSILSSIAEGYESQTNSVFMQHLSIAKGSAGEVRAQLYVALDQKYFTET